MPQMCALSSLPLTSEPSLPQSSIPPLIFPKFLSNRLRIFQFLQTTSPPPYPQLLLQPANFNMPSWSQPSPVPRHHRLFKLLLPLHQLHLSSCQPNESWQVQWTGGMSFLQNPDRDLGRIAYLDLLVLRYGE